MIPFALEALIRDDHVVAGGVLRSRQRAGPLRDEEMGTYISVHDLVPGESMRRDRTSAQRLATEARVSNGRS